MPSLPRQKFLEHLDALRGALVGAAFAWILGAAVVAANFGSTLQLLKLPLKALNNFPGGAGAQGGVDLITLNPLTGLFIGFNIVTAGGVIVGAPLMLLYLLKFFIPALTPREQKMGLTITLIAVGLFLCGVAFGFFWMLPMSLNIALQIQNALGFKLLWSAEDYFSLVVTLPLIMGFAFCIPLIVATLLKLGVLPYHTLAKRWDIATLVILIVAAAITPTGDPISFLFIAVPLAILYALALLFGRPTAHLATRD